MTLLRQVSSFALVGASCTLLQYVILYLLVTTLTMRPAFASTIGFLASAALNYALNYRYTFQSSRSHAISFPRFSTVATIGLLLNALIMHIGTEPLGLNYFVVQIGATTIVLLWNFAANRKWSF